jgi:hypothetical protein
VHLRAAVGLEQRAVAGIQMSPILEHRAAAPTRDLMAAGPLLPWSGVELKLGPVCEQIRE